ncbi:MAG: type I glyceraldehyde-3-phosphate dehydrogenase [Flavobacteriales bacterium]|nr:type I glyceraldehyde-3-phosphate dehydrogenase [Flavobacteriales bacterium]
MIKVGINGFGRIGRMVTREITRREGVEVVAINDPEPLSALGHLFDFDSVHGRFPGDVKVDQDCLVVDGKAIRKYSESSPCKIPWFESQADIVLECSGLFKDRKTASQHLGRSVKKVIISAATTDESIPMVVLGVNEGILSSFDTVISNASCTTNNAAPMIDLIHEHFNIESCYITTVHSYTGDQKLHDSPHHDLRRARAAALSIVPTTTGAAKALNHIFPDLTLKIGGCGIRVPVPDGSLTDMTCIVSADTSVEEVNEVFERASNGKHAGFLEYTEEPIVSTDIIGNPHSCVFDAALTSVIGRMVKVVGWYDNEIGYSNRLVELVKRVG